MIINGENMEFKSGITINNLLESLKLLPERVVVEVNMDIIPREKYSFIELDERDTIEIVGFVGGG